MKKVSDNQFAVLYDDLDTFNDDLKVESFCYSARFSRVNEQNFAEILLISK